MTTAAVIRTALPTDLAPARGVVLAAYWPYAAVAPTAVFPTYLADVLDVERHSRFGALLVAEVDGRILAVVTFQPDARVQSFGWPVGWASGRGLAVHPDGRGLGLARALLAECDLRAQASGADVFAFHTGNFMTGAQRVYERMGYHRIPEFDVDIGAHYGIVSAQRHIGLAYCRELTDPGAAGVPLAA